MKERGWIHRKVGELAEIGILAKGDVEIGSECEGEA